MSEQVINNKAEDSYNDITNKSNFEGIFNSLYLKAEKLIKIKKENDRLVKEHFSHLKKIEIKLNNLLKEIDIDNDIEFYISDIIKEVDIRENIEKYIGNKFNDEIKNIFIEIINESVKNFESLHKYILLRKINNDTSKKNINYKNVLINKSEKNIIQKYNHDDVIKNPLHYVEFAVSNNEIKNIKNNIDEVISLEIETKKQQNSKFIEAGKRKLNKPNEIIIDDKKDIKDYVEDYQTSGRLGFNKEEDAKTWRCLTFSENYGKRPYGIYIVKNQQLF